MPAHCLVEISWFDQWRTTTAESRFSWLAVYQFEYWPSDERFYFGGHPYTLFCLFFSFHGWLIYFCPSKSAEIAQKEDVVDKRKTRDKSAEPLADINGSAALSSRFYFSKKKIIKFGGNQRTIVLWNNRRDIIRSSVCTLESRKHFFNRLWRRCQLVKLKWRHKLFFFSLWVIEMGSVIQDQTAHLNGLGSMRVRESHSPASSLYTHCSMGYPIPLDL